MGHLMTSTLLQYCLYMAHFMKTTVLKYYMSTSITPQVKLYIYTYTFIYITQQHCYQWCLFHQYHNNVSFLNMISLVSILSCREPLDSFQAPAARTVVSGCGLDFRDFRVRFFWDLLKMLLSNRNITRCISCSKDLWCNRSCVYVDLNRQHFYWTRCFSAI